MWVEFTLGAVLNRPMNTLPRLLLVLLAVVCWSPARSANGSATLPDAFDVAGIDAYLAAKVAEDKLVGLSVAIVRDSEVALAKGYGKRSLTDGRAVDADTLFAIGSISKQFTCAAILLLSEDGKLSAHDPVAKWYPQLTRANDITLLDLMNHVSGYPDYYPLDFVDRRMAQAIDPDELLRQYAGGKLDFEPGAKYSYSNTGYILLGRVVEKVTGKPFGEILAERILKPLGMSQTLYEPAAGDPRVADGYTMFALSDPERIGPEGRGWIAAAGGIFSTPTDLAKWNLALTGGKVLRPASYELMTRKRQLKDGRLSDYGCGLQMRSQGGRDVLVHTGAVSGFNAYNATIPGTRSAVTVFVNLEGGLGSIPGDLLGLLLKVHDIIPDIQGPAAVEAAKSLLAGYQAGKVDRTRLGEEFNIFLTDEKLAGVAGRLKPFGTPTKAELVSRNERGGMEVSVTRLTFEHGQLRTLMYRQPDGTVEQFFVYED